MANKKSLEFVPDAEQLKLLAQGVEIWNAWRKDNLEVFPYLNEANLSGLNLRKANLSYACLQLANLCKADLIGADLRRSKLYRANLIEAKLDGANLSGVDLNLSFINGATCTGANLEGADLCDANLTQVNFSYAKLNGAYLREADLYGTNFSFAKLNGADFSGAKLFNTNFDGAEVDGADFTEAHIGGVLFVNTDLSSTKGLDTVKHYQPSSVGVDTLYISGGKIPENFLEGCGYPESFVANLGSLVGAEDAIKFYSCFISYSSKDEEFARRLHSRMRDEYLRVWFAPEDVQGGQKLHEQIERAIHLHDRLLIVLSEHSLQSEWVKTEIRKARNIEVQESRRKLFPISLVPFGTIRDWECFDADNGKDLGVEIREYFIPDFTGWKNQDAFEEAFKRLLRDLKVNEYR